MNPNTSLRSALVLSLFLLGALYPALAASPIADALQPFVEKEELAGAVALVASKDKVLAVEAVGFADRATKRPMKADALFWIASQSKSITATAVMMLVDEGKLDLDAPVEKYLPAAPSSRDAPPAYPDGPAVSLDHQRPDSRRGRGAGT